MPGPSFAALPSVADHLALYVPDRTSAMIRFRPQHLENLLNQAADLLERCVAERDRYNALRAQWFSVTSDFLLKDARANAEEGRSPSFAHQWEDAQFQESSLRNEDALARAAVANLSNVIANGGGLANNRDWETARAESNRQQAAAAQVARELTLAERQLLRENPMVAGTPTENPISTLVVQQAYLRATIEERGRIKGALELGQPLDFWTQAAQSVDRVLRDYKDAVDRLLVASEGLTSIFDYSDAFVPLLSAVAAGSATGLEAAVDWTREAIRWLTAFSQLDQSFTVCLSLRQALGNDWKKLADGTYHFFAFDAGHVAGHRYVRLRSLSAWARLDSPDFFPVACTIRLPKGATYTFESASAGDAPSPHVSQSSVPSCTLGSVLDWRVPGPPEECGAVSLRNGSPIGHIEGSAGAATDALWSVRLDRVTAGKPADIGDIVLKISLSGRPKPRL